MGGNSTSSYSSVVQTAVNSLSANCDTSLETAQVLDCSGVTIVDCNNFQMLCQNNSSQTSVCNLDQVAETTADAIATSNANTQNGILPLLNIGDSTNSVSTIRQNLAAYMQSACGTSEGIKQTMQGGGFSCYGSNNAKIMDINNSSQQGLCVIKALSDLGMSAAATSSATTSGWRPSLGGLIGIIIAVVVIILVVGAVFLFKPSGGSANVTTAAPAASAPVPGTVSAPAPAPAPAPALAPAPAPAPTPAPAPAAPKGGRSSLLDWRAYGGGSGKHKLRRPVYWGSYYQ